MSAFLKGFLSLTSVGLLRSILMLLVQWVAIDVSSKEEYGIYVFSFTIFSIVSTLSQNITSDYSFKILSKNSSNSLSTSDAINIIKFERSVSLFGVLVYVVISVILVAMNLAHLSLSLIFALGLVVVHPLSYLKNALISSDKIRKLAEFELVNISTSFIVSVALTYYLGIIGLALGQAFLLLFRQYVSWKYHNLFRHSDNLIMPNLFVLKKYGSMGIRNGLQNVYQNVDLIAMNFLFGTAMIAEYKLAKSLASIPSKLLNPLWSSLRGKIFAPYVAGRRMEAMSYIFRGVSIVFILYCFLILLNYYFGADFITKIYGLDFKGTQRYMYWVLLLFLMRDASLSWFGLLLSINSWDNLMNTVYSIILAFISVIVAIKVGEVEFFVALLFSSIILLVVSYIRTYWK